MIDKQYRMSTFYDKAVLLSVSSLLVMGFFVFMCMGKKKKLKGDRSQAVEEVEIVIDVENKQESSAPMTALSENEVSATIQETVKSSEVEILPMYDPTKSQSQASIDPYATIDKESIKKDGSVTSVANENSASGSGNSDSGNGLYAKVKKVVKEEEIAYAVVDIKNSQDKYDMINGGIVRRLTEPDTDTTLSPKEEHAESKPVTPDVLDTQESNEKKAETEKISAGFDLYESVKCKDESDSNEMPSSPKQEVVIDAYAVVIKAEPALISTMNPGEQEDSGASGCYAKVDNTHSSVSPQPDPPPPPPPHPHPPHPKGMPIGSNNTEIDIGAYEPITTDITTDLERCNTYDSISEYKHDSKGKKDKKGHQGEGGKKHKHASKHKKSHKKQDSIGEASNSSTKSPKNRFSRVNPFKLSKKQKHKHSTDNVNVEQSGNEFELNEPIDIPLHKEKGASLPSSARKSQNEIEHSDVVKRHSSPHVPPPLPSVEQLIHLAQHQNPKRGSSFDACSSPETSPKNSPRTPLDMNKPLPQCINSRITSSNNVSGNDTTRESRVHSEASDDNYSSINASTSIEPSFDEDDKYTLVNNEIKDNISLNKETVVVEKDCKYAKVDSDLKLNLLSNKATDVVEEDDKYSKVDSDLKLNLLNKETNVVEEDDKYTTVDSDLKLNLLNKETDTVEDDKYTTVDSGLKLNLLNNKDTDVVEGDDKCTTVEINTDHNLVNGHASVAEEDDKSTLVKENSEKPITSVVTIETLNDKSHPVDRLLMPEVDLPDYAAVDLVKKHQERERLRTMSQTRKTMSAHAPQQTTVTKSVIIDTDDYEAISSTSTSITSTSVTSTIISATPSTTITRTPKTIEPLRDSTYEEIGKLKTTITTLPIEQDKRFSTDSADYMYVE